jgi:hypothetical protein
MTTPSANPMLDKIRAMLALAESERELGHEDTAEAHTATAARWMAKHGIDKALADAKAGTKAKPGNRKFLVKSPYADCGRYLLSTIAKAFGCQVVLLPTRNADEVVHVFGYDTDIEQIDLLYTSLLLQMSAALRLHPIAPWYTGRALYAERRSFLLGFPDGVRPLLEAAYGQATAEADDSGTVGTALVLADRSLAVIDAKTAAYPKLRTVRTTYRGGSGAAGRAAGARANVHSNRQTGAGSRAALR